MGGSHGGDRPDRQADGEVSQAAVCLLLDGDGAVGVERAHSNWTHLWSAGLEPVGDVVQACAEEDRRIAAGWAEFWHYTSLGRYGEQLEHLFGLFPREQVLLLRYRR